jgi:hypothetical protein
MPFATVAVPFDAYRELPSPTHRWLLTCLARYADREGRCWPSMRQLAVDARMSKSSVQRHLADLSQLGVFSRARRSGGRYSYTLAVAFVPRWRSQKTAVAQRVPSTARGVPIPGAQKAFDIKHHDLPDDSLKWEARLRGWHRSRFWLPFWGPRPNETGCWAPIGRHLP